MTETHGLSIRSEKGGGIQASECKDIFCMYTIRFYNTFPHILFQVVHAGSTSSFLEGHPDYIPHMLLIVKLHRFDGEREERFPVGLLR